MKEMKDVEPVNKQNELMNEIVQLLQNGNADDGDKEVYWILILKKLVS